VGLTLGLHVLEKKFLAFAGTEPRGLPLSNFKNIQFFLHRKKIASPSEEPFG
jgi:hypothetical protein